MLKYIFLGGMSKLFLEKFANVIVTLRAGPPTPPLNVMDFITIYNLILFHNSVLLLHSFQESVRDNYLLIASGRLVGEARYF